MAKKQLDLTEGPIYKTMLLFALPVLLGNIFQQLYNTFDAWCVGNYLGADAYNGSKRVWPSAFCAVASPLRSSAAFAISLPRG